MFLVALGIYLKAKKYRGLHFVSTINTNKTETTKIIL